MRLLCFVLLVLALQPMRSLGADDYDPIEPVNRGIFWFNDTLDVYVMEPVAKGWDFVLPERAQRSISDFFHNLRSPVYTANSLLQGKPVRAGEAAARFAINTMAGFLGFFDPAGEVLGLERHEEDFGQTLGVWGAPPGPYLMLPFFGPSNLRDGAAQFVDSFTAVYPIFVGITYTIAPRVVHAVNSRAQALEQIEEAKQAAVDYYALVRNAYNQHRRVLINDGDALTEEEKEDLYYFDEYYSEE